ncbi:MAG: DUF6056 family protein, partial [Elusimicrobia bacterium]|nr:DUF6056 family protein [Elusimicrobiota bacterium]
IMPPARVVNVIYLLFIISWFLNIFVITRRIKEKSQAQFAGLPYCTLIAGALIIVSLAGKNNIRTAYSNLLKGTAHRYNEEIKSRYDAIGRCGYDLCEVEKIKHYPETIFFADIKEDENHWINTAYAEYFGKKAIRIKK